MCGICGKISCDGQILDKDLIEKMSRAISYRGPDDSGTYFSHNGNNPKSEFGVGFGHKRLSIIDLSNSAHQPMSNEDNTVWITYNGEIYNFNELKTELERKGHVFKSCSDTEVIIHSYEELGLEAIQRLNGMFAFAVWDNQLKRLWVGRDRIGIKPLVYFWDGKHFIFASEIKALLADPIVSKEIDFEALYMYLTFNYIPAPYTIFKGIRKLEPGHYLTIENGNLNISKYWDTPLDNDAELSRLSLKDQEEEYKKNLHTALDQAVKARMIADVPLGAFLSGGIDSSIIVALMSRHASRPFKTFSIGYKDDGIYDETGYAKAVARKYHTEHREFKLSYQDMLGVLPDILSSFDEPFADSSAIPTFIVSRETRNHVTVALSGDGGDELFAGYRSYLAEFWFKKYMMIPGLLREGLAERIINLLPDSRDTRCLECIRRLKKFIKGTKGSFADRVLSLKEVFPKDVRHKILLEKASANSDHDLSLAWVDRLLSSHAGDRLNRILYSDLKDSLPGDMLTKVDWMSMINSLEVRVPFLDHRLVELAFKMPGCLKLKNGKTKYILKETFKDLLPPMIYRRSKAGFEVPISRWLKNELKYLLDQYLAEDRIQNQGIFDPGIIKQLVGNHLSGKTDTSWMLWNIIVFQSWYENYFL
jgi:asparagine synthase (glutamine-hydrolysing)